MKHILCALIILSPFSTWAYTCKFRGQSLTQLNEMDDYKVEFAAKIPFPPKLLETLEKYFGNFSDEKCKNAIVAAKINHVSKKETLYAFYTNENDCDGGNSYGLVFRSTDKDHTSPIATIEDSRLECL